MPRLKDRQPSPGPPVDPAAVRPRHTAADDFEQNPLSHVAERVSLKAAQDLDDEGRVREALRIVLAEGVAIPEAARRCGVAPSFLREWRIKYLALLNEEASIAAQPLMDQGLMDKDADLIRIPRAAQELFEDNWRRLVERTRATPATFHQSTVRLFLENSWLTSWLYTDGELDRGTAWGAAVAVAAILTTGTFFAAGRFYRPSTDPAPAVENVEAKLKEAAEAGRAFFKAPDVESKFQLVRPAERTRELMVSYYKTRAPAIPDAVLKKAWPHMGGVYSLEFSSELLGRNILLNVVERSGRMQVEWESSSLFMEVYVEELRKTKPLSPVPIAVKAEHGDYYNYGFTEDKYTCYRLSYPGLEVDLFGYTAKGSLEDQALGTLAQPFTAGERAISAVLEIKYPAPDAAANQVQIVRILHESWVKD